jgi:hypothetical protein
VLFDGQFNKELKMPWRKIIGVCIGAAIGFAIGYAGKCSGGAG